MELVSGLGCCTFGSGDFGKSRFWVVTGVVSAVSWSCSFGVGSVAMAAARLAAVSAFE